MNAVARSCIRRIAIDYLAARGWLLLACLLTGCASLPRNPTKLDSGTFRDDLNLRTGKYRRQVIQHIPKGYNAARPCPLVVCLHGAFSRSSEIREWSEWSQLADREGFIVIYPEGIGILGYLQHWNAGHCCGKAVADDWDDVSFIEAAIEGTCRQYSVDRRRIYMTGFSNGGMMAYRYAAERANELAAVASVAGTIGSRASADQPAWRLPAPESPVPALIIHGTADSSVPIMGGKADKRNSTREYRSVTDAADFWISANHCVIGPVKVDAWGGMVTMESWTDAEGQNEVCVYRIQNWGHTWPGGNITRALPKGHPLKDFDAAEIIWRFFQRHEKSL